MTPLEKLEKRKRKLHEFYETLKPVDLHVQAHDGYSTNPSPLARVIYEELDRVETEIAKIRLSEFLNIDENFEKEVLE